VTGQGLFAVVRARYSRPLLLVTLTGVVVGNVFEAAADLGGMAAAVQLVVPGGGWPFEAIVTGIAAAVVALQLWAPYRVIRNIFRWLALVLLAYVAAAILAAPGLAAVVRGTLVPTIRFDREFLSLLVAIVGTSLSAYLFTWQSNEEVEEEIAMGRRRLSDRVGATAEELRRTRRDVLFGMVFSNVIMYFIILATGTALFPAGHTNIDSAADAARALQPLAGRAAGALFTLGVIGVGFLAVPVMTSGAAYDIAQSLGWRSSLGATRREAGKFYAAIVAVTVAAVALNFLGWNPMRVLVWSGIVQGFSTPPLMLMILLLTNDRAVMGDRVNGRAINVLAWVTTVAIFSASFGLVLAWIL
jgi:Mn2+/Fe2+ NRAMP family transporter